MRTKDYSKYKFNITKSPVDYRDWKVGAIFPKLVFPPELDYRVSFFPIRDQEDTDECAAFGGAAMKEWQERIESNINEYLSPQFIYSNREDLTTGGMYTRDLMKILKEKGVCTELQFPFRTKGMPSVETYIQASKYKILNFASVNTLDEAKTALFLNGPCVIAFPVYNYSERFWHKLSGQQLLGGHLVVLGGYIKEGLIIRNSWGTEWGINGYSIMPYEDFGEQWEIWTTIDAKSIDPTPEPIPVPDPVPDPDPIPDPLPDRKGCLHKFW